VGIADFKWCLFLRILNLSNESHVVCKKVEWKERKPRCV
jgi:hypothetical protein